MADRSDALQPLLLDSHAFLWALDDSELLGANVRAALRSGREAWLSSATVWELGMYRWERRVGCERGEGEDAAAHGTSDAAT